MTKAEQQADFDRASGADEQEREEHFPWSYTQAGVLCACGAPMGKDERCYAVKPLIIKPWPLRPDVIVRGDHFVAASKLPDCLNCGQDELYVNPASGRIGCYVCGVFA